MAIYTAQCTLCKVIHNIDLDVNGYGVINMIPKDDPCLAALSSSRKVWPCSKCKSVASTGEVTGHILHHFVVQLTPNQYKVKAYGSNGRMPIFAEPSGDDAPLTPESDT